MFACNGILFNHESPIRGETFVTRKITRAAARIALGLQEKLFLGNLDAQRDWGHAKDYVYGMWLMLQQEKPMDLVLATGESRSVRYFVQKAFEWLGVELEFKGQGRDEVGVISTVDEKRMNELELEPMRAGREIIAVDPRYFRPTEVDFLVGDAARAKEILGWVPKHDLDSLIHDMMENDLTLNKKEKYLQDGGYRTFEGYE